MNEERFASRIRQALDQGNEDISPAIARRLEAARSLALARQKQPVAELAPAGQGIRPDQRLTGRPPHFRQALAILALLFGMWLSLYWHSLHYHQEIEATDGALLTDDLPPDALLDNDLLEWLKDDTLEQ